MKQILVTVLIVSSILTIWSGWVFESCGYDCGIFSVQGKPASILGLTVGGLIMSISLIMLFISKNKNSKL